MEPRSRLTVPELPSIEKVESVAQPAQPLGEKRGNPVDIRSRANELAPKFFRHQFRWLFVGAAMTIVFGFAAPVMGLLDAYGFVSISPGYFRKMWIVWLYGLLPGALVLAGVSIWRLRVFRRFIRQNEYLVCLQCGYSLRGIPDHYECPECGVEYDHARLRVEWKRLLGEKPDRSG